MTDEEAVKLAGELGLDPDQEIVVEISIRNMIMLNELVTTAQAWRKTPGDGPLTVRLIDAIDAYNAADYRAQGA